MRVFYSHPMMKYSDEIEKVEIKYINNAWDENVEVINPHVVIRQDEPEDEAMQRSYKIISGCDCVVFSTMSGIIGQGTYNEIIYALNIGKKVYQLYGDKIYSILSANSFVKDIVSSIIFTGNNREYAVVYPPIRDNNRRLFTGSNYSTRSGSVSTIGCTTTE